MKNKFDEEINLTRDEVDKLEDAIEFLRNYGRVHFKFDKEEIITKILTAEK